MNPIDKIFEDFTETPCRACMFKCPITAMIDLFKEDKIGNIFTEFTSLQVTELDGLPSHLCQICYEVCTQFWEFKLKCITSDKVFRQEIAIKQEQDEKAESFIDTKSIDILVKTEADIESSTSFHDFSECKDIVSDDDNKPTLKKNKNSCTKTKNESDSDWNNYSDDDNKKPKKKPKRKKLSKKNAKNDTSREKFFCDHCDKVFHKKHRIQAHLRTHLGLKPFACDICNLSFRRWDSIVSHNKIKHVPKDKVKRFICHYENCGRQYSMKETLRKHITAYHLGRKTEKIICELCGKSSPSSFAAKEHNYTHTGEKPYACTICPKKFISNYQLKIHLMRHNDIRNHVCSVCGLRKTTKKELKIHMNYHTKEKSYPCDKCPSVFNSYQNVSRHNKVVHLGSRPYLCTICQRSFSKAETLRNHIMTHTGEKPHACNLCDKRFIQAVALRTHMKVHDKAKKAIEMNF